MNATQFTYLLFTSKSLNKEIYTKIYNGETNRNKDIQIA